MCTSNPKLLAFERLLQIISELRQKCPWDKKQTLESLRMLTLEEAYELNDAIAKEETEEIKKELGDLVMHIVFYAEIANETKLFDIADVLNGVCEKLIYRHPHVYGETTVKDEKQVLQNWEELKLKEKGGNKTVLGGVPDSLPALIKAYRIQEKARAVGFDWEEREQVWEKVKEEMVELEEELTQSENLANKEAELGDLLFSLINMARLYNLNPTNALEQTNRKFIKRFNYLEAQTLKKGLDLKEMSLEEMNRYWEEAKSL